MRFPRYKFHTNDPVGQLAKNRKIMKEDLTKEAKYLPDSECEACGQRGSVYRIEKEGEPAHHHCTNCGHRWASE